MIKFNRHNILLVLCVGIVALSGIGVKNSAASGTDQERLLLSKINAARQNPLKAAEEIGIDTSDLIEKLPELKNVLTNGIVNLWHNEELYSAARNHSKDMVENNYYEHMSSEGLTVADRIKAAGYPDRKSGESIAVLAFYNFLTTDDAVDYLFEYLYREELNSERTEERYILNAEYQEVGIGIQSGTWTIGKVDYNIILVTCDFGVRTENSETNSNLELYQLLNQARSAPLEYASSLGIDTEQLLTEVDSSFGDVLTNGMPLLSFNSTLFWVSGFHTLDMMTNHFVSGLSSADGKSYEERLAAWGYEYEDAGESVDYLEVESYLTPVERVEGMFNKLFLKEIDSKYTGERKILNSGYKEVGIGFGLTSLYIDGESKNAYVSTFDFGNPKENYYLSGTAYVDTDSNGVISSGEELVETGILLEALTLSSGETSTRQVRTDSLGGINVTFSEPVFLKTTSILTDGKPIEILPVLVNEQAPNINTPADEMTSLLYVLVNQARSNPMKLAASLGIDTNELLATSNDELKDILTNGVPPLGLSNALTWTAGYHTFDMMVNSFYSVYSSADSKNYEERMVAAGYTFSEAGEVVASVNASSYPSSSEAAEALFNELFLKEIDPEYTGERKILGVEYTEIGIGFGLGSRIGDDRKWEKVYVSTFDFGATMLSPLYLTGRIYEDLNSNGLYSPGEGISGVTVFIEKYVLPLGEFESFQTKTGNNGVWNIAFSDPAYIKASVDYNGNSKTEIVPLLKSNSEFEFRIESGI